VAIRAGVVAAMVAGLLTFVAAPAQADHDVRLGGVGNVELRVGGGPQNVQLRVENRNGSHTNPVDGTVRGVTLTMTVPLADRGVNIASTPDGCSLSSNNTRMDCTLPDIPSGQTWSGVAQLAVQGNSSVQAGETENGTAQVQLSTGGQTTYNVRVQGPDRPPGVAEVAGFVTNEQTGDPIPDAQVFLTDGQGVELQTSTNDSGQYRFSGQDIAAGSIGLRASKDGFESFSTTKDVQPGESVTIQLAIRSTATSAPPETSAPPTTAPPGSPTVVPVADTSSGGSFFTTVMVVLGIVFVLLGVGAIALLIYRRRKERLEDEGDEGPEGAGGPISGPPGPRPTPGSHGVYRPSETQVMGGAQTQVMGPGGRPVPAVGPQPALASAQTSMMRPTAANANDQTAMIPRATDPTGPPGPRPPVAGTPPPPRPAAPTYGGTPVAGYEDPRGRHGAPPDRYDNPTELYGGRGQADGYGRSGPPTQPGQPGQADGYGRSGPPSQPDRFGQRGQAYGSPAAGAAPPPAPAPGGGTYGNPAHGSPAGRPEPGGYGTEGGYRPADGGYRAEPAPPAHGRHDRGGGYGTPAYEGGGSYGPDPYSQPAQPAGYEPDGYEQPTSSYGGQGYRGSGAGGYGSADGYGGSGGHQGSGGYDRSGGYSGQTYGQQQPGHAAPPAEQPAGYEGNDYYDESGAPRSRRADPPERRRLDWLDDS
jgi:hypothetical protein